MQTFAQLLQRMEDRLSLYGGIDVNTYAQPKLVAIFQSVYDNLFDMRWWKHLLVNEDFALDPVEGFVADSIQTWVKRFCDIRYVWVDSQISPLPVATMDINPNKITSFTVEPYNDPEKLFRIRPLGSVTACTIQFRTKPDPFTTADDVNFDEEALILGTCAEFTLTIGANASLAKMFMAKYEERVKHLISLEETMSKSLYPETAQGIMSWRDA